MSMAVCLLIATSLGAEPSERSSHPIAPQFEARQELVWSGIYTEEINRGSTKRRRAFDFETRLLVLNRRDTGTELALLTSFTLQPDPQTKEPIPAPLVRLELIHVATNGKVTSIQPAPWLDNQPAERKTLPPLPLEGLPTFETGMFIEIPSPTLAEGLTWDSAESGRPFRSWKVVRIQHPRGAHCFQMVSEQESDNWSQGSSTRPLFRRTEEIQLAASSGFACKVDRRIEKKDPNSSEVNVDSRLIYEQKSKSRLTGDAFREQFDELREVIYSQAVLDQLMPKVGRDPKPFDGLLNHISTYEINFKSREESSFREVLVQLKQKAEMARRGQIPPNLNADETIETNFSELKLNQSAADLLVSRLDDEGKLRLKRLRNTPVVLLYLQPTSSALRESLEFSDRLISKYEDRLAVVPLMIGKLETLGTIRREWQIKLPIYDGNEARLRHRVESTPRVVILDREGVVRAILDGWGKESPELIQRELEKWVK